MSVGISVVLAEKKKADFLVAAKQLTGFDLLNP